MAKFRCGYSVKWNFNGTIEVEADSADEAEKKAQARLDVLAGNDKFDDVSDFKAEFDDANVLDVEEIEGEENDSKYADERFFANKIAALPASDFDHVSAAKAVAEAVVLCKEHPVVCEGDGRVSFSYCNSFGPTCGVDDVLESMNMCAWRMACDEFCKLVLRKGGLDPESFDWPTPLPEVMKVPENEGTDVIARVNVTFKVDEKTYQAILETTERMWRRAGDPDADGKPDAFEEEICVNCDHEIRYLPEKGKRVVTCPECGAANPLCNECDHDAKKCAKCEVSKLCDRINELRADNAPEREE